MGMAGAGPKYWMQVELVREEIKAMVPRAGGAPHFEAVVQSVASALFGLLAWWMDARTRMTVGEVSDLFRGMAVPAVRAAFR